MRTLTPFELDILLHYHSIAGDCRACVDNVPIWAETRNWMLENDLLRHAGGIGNATYILGPRGQCFIDHILSLPLPKQTWTIAT